MPPRQVKYTKISMDMKQKLINAINKGESMQLTCNILEIPVRTGQHIYQKFVAHGQLLPDKPRGGPKLKKVSDQQILQIRSWIDENCQITIKAIKLRILAEFGIYVSDGTICNYIKSFHYTFKKVAKIPNAADTPELWVDRVAFCHWYTEQKVLGKTFIYLDEVGFQVIF